MENHDETTLKADNSKDWLVNYSKIAWNLRDFWFGTLAKRCFSFNNFPKAFDWHFQRASSRGLAWVVGGSSADGEYYGDWKISSKIQWLFLGFYRVLYLYFVWFYRVLYLFYMGFIGFIPFFIGFWDTSNRWVGLGISEASKVLGDLSQVVATQIVFLECSPRKLGMMNPFWRPYFFKWVGSTTNEFQ